MTREQAQKTAVKLSKVWDNLILEWCTGLGKTLAAINIIEANFTKTNPGVSGDNWYIVIAETNHEYSWREEFKKHNKEHLLDVVTFICYQSLHKWTKGTHYILDEIHHLQSEKRLDLLDIIKRGSLQQLVGLSATLTWKQKENITNVIGATKTYKITLSEAIEWKILPEPKVFLVEVELDNTLKNCLFESSKDKVINCTEKVKYKYMTDRIEWLKDKYMLSRTHFQKIAWLKKANERKKFLADCKTKHAKKLLECLKDKRLICFTGSIKQSEELSKGNSIHSKIPKKKRELMLENFNGGVSNKLFATGMLKEGVNLNNIQAGIIVQLDNVERYFTQVSGRTLRAMYPEQYILYVKDTQDEVYVNTALTNFNMDYVTKINIKNLNLINNDSNNNSKEENTSFKSRNTHLPPGEADWL